MKYTLVGQNGNAFNLMGYTQGAMQEQKFTEKEIQLVISNAKLSDYDNLVAVLTDALDLCNERAGCDT